MAWSGHEQKGSLRNPDKNTMKTVTFKITVAIIVAILATGIIATHNYYFAKSSPAHLALLLPDSADTESPGVKVWLDAIEEEGFLVTVIRDSEFLRPWTNRTLFSGIILPDNVHKEASDTLVSTLSSYVENGGNLMLVYDAGVWSLAGRYTGNFSRFSDLAGVKYAYYNRLQEKTIGWQPVLGSARVFSALHIPPGKYLPYDDLASKKSPVIDKTRTGADKTHSISGYEKALVSYDIYHTDSNYDGDVLLQSVAGDIVAGQRRHGKGNVLFVNLPLGYLKGRTDGLFLHSFLHYFSGKIVRLPYIAAVPDARGGVVMNWHLDSNVTFRPLERLRSLGIYKQGPYSIHITAGPDTRFTGDKTGINVPGNKRIQKWIKYFTQKGHKVGSHGGWIHDRFGDHVKDKPTPEFEAYLARNKRALEKVMGVPVTEYSAPKGNHPEWVTGWLSKNRIHSYYFTGNTGMAPTRSYRNGILQYADVWSFPILPYRDMAGFEELVNYKISPGAVKDWLVSTSDFVASTHSVRLIYFHPRGALHYKKAMQAWLAKAETLQQQKRFRWYTMTEIANFLSRRNKVRWELKEDQGLYTISASHPESLARMAWVLSADSYDKPVISEGNGTVRRENNQWIVTAGKGIKITIRLKAVQNG